MPFAWVNVHALENGLPLSLRLTHAMLCALLPSRQRNYSLFFHVQNFTSFSQLWCAIVNAKHESNSSTVIDDCMSTIYYILATFLSNIRCCAYRTHSENRNFPKTDTQTHAKSESTPKFSCDISLSAG